MPIVGGHTNKYTNPMFPCFITKSDMCGTNATFDALKNYCVGTFTREGPSKSKLCGGMYSAINNNNVPWNVLENKLAFNRSNALGCIIHITESSHNANALL